MRYQRLFIRNLLSIESAEVDFEHSPLAGEPLFLITGETGAGKSTLLDAISLSLYGMAPRMSRTTRSEKYYSEVDDEMSVNHISQMMRRHTAKSSTTLFFEGNDGKNYKASWEIHRARGKVDGKLQPAVNTITEKESGVSVTKQEDLKEVIDRAVGMTYEQFCRTSLLAQGEFTRFLHSEPNEKAEILEKLTGTEIYSEIGRRIFETQRQKLVAYNTAKEKLGDIELLTDEQRKSIQQVIAGLETQIAEQNVQKTQVEGHLDILKNLALSERKEQRLSYELTEMRAQVQSEEYLQDLALVRDYRNTSEVRTSYSRETKVQKAILELEGKREFFEHSYATALGKWEATKRLMSDQQAQADAQEEYLSQRAPHADMYAEQKAIDLRLIQLSDARKEANDAVELRTKLAQELKQMNEDCRTLLLQKTDVDKTLAEITAELTSSSESLKSHNPSALTARQNAIVQTLADLTSLNRLYDDITKDKQKYEEWTADQQKWQGQLSLLQKELPRLLQTEAHAKGLYDTALLTGHEVVKNLRASLHKGDHCPVCGHAIDHDPAEHALDVATQPLKEEWLKTKGECEKCRDDIKEAETNLKNGSQLLKEISDRLTANEGQVDELKRAWEGNFPSDSAAIEALRTTLREEQEGLAISQKEIEELRATIESLQTSEKKQNKKWETLTNDIHQKDLSIQAQEGKIEAETQREKSSLKKAKEVKEELMELLTYEDKDTLLSGDLMTLRQRVEAETKAYSSSQDALKESREAHQELQRECLECQDLYDSILLLLPDWTEPEIPTAEYDKNWLQEWRDVERKLIDWTKEIAREQKELDEAHLFVDQYLENTEGMTRVRLESLSKKTPEEIEKLANQHAEHTRDLAKKEGEHEASRKAKEEWQQKKDEAQIAGTLEDLDQAVKAVTKTIADLNEQKAKECYRLEHDEEQQTRLAQVQTQVERAEQELNQWNELNQYFGDAKGSTFRAIAQSYILAHLLRLANDYLLRFSDRYILTCSPGSLAILVTDLERGFTPQSIHVLSGGESFMVSLALALALSSMGSVQQHLDLLFIDEGFGTLDSECLNSVMTTLETLHHIGGRRVGIISHVEELKERIPTQIRVKRVSPSKSEVQVLSMQDQSI